MPFDKYQKISISCSNDIIEAFSNFLLEHDTGGLVVEDNILNGQTVLTAYIQLQKHKPLTKDEISNFFSSLQSFFPDATYDIVNLDYIRAEDWLAGWKKTFTPIHVTDKIVIRPTWQSYEPKPGEIEIIIDPKMAFGTGHHETTAQCLTAMEKIGVDGKRVLDYGCGTGILAIAAFKMGALQVTAVDLDPEAIACARENIAINKAVIELVESGKYISDSPGDLIAANLSIDQIIELFGNLDASLKTDGLIICSGIPHNDRQRFLDFMDGKSYNIVDVLPGSEWISYIGKKTKLSNGD